MQGDKATQIQYAGQTNNIDWPLTGCRLRTPGLSGERGGSLKIIIIITKYHLETLHWLRKGLQISHYFKISKKIIRCVLEPLSSSGDIINFSFVPSRFVKISRKSHCA
jgi:hypothetical protein